MIVEFAKEVTLGVNGRLVRCVVDRPEGKPPKQRVAAVPIMLDRNGEIMTDIRGDILPRHDDGIRKAHAARVMGWILRTPPKGTVCDICHGRKNIATKISRDKKKIVFLCHKCQELMRVT